MSSLSTLDDAFYPQAVDAIYESLATSIVFVYSHGVAFETAAVCYGQAFGYIDDTGIAQCRPVARERILHRSMVAMDRRSRPASLRFSVSASDVVFYDHGNVLDGPGGEYAVGCSCKRTRFHSIENLRNAIVSLIEQVVNGKSSAKIKSRTSDPFTIPSCNLVTHVLIDAIAAMTRIRVQDPFPYRQKSRERLGAYAARSISPASRVMRSMDTKRCVVVFRTE